jgi:hypothetical protein
MMIAFEFARYLRNLGDFAAAKAIEDRDREVRAKALREAAQKVDAMVVGGRAWNAEQEAAAVILFDVANGLRDMADRAERGES